jgi:hypothetical protein
MSNYYKEPTGNDIRSINIRRRNRGEPLLNTTGIYPLLRCLYDGYDPLPEWKKMPCTTGPRHERER